MYASLMVQIAAITQSIASVQAEVTPDFMPQRHNDSYELGLTSIDEAQYTDISGFNVLVGDFNEPDITLKSEEFYTVDEHSVYTETITSRNIEICEKDASAK